MDWLNDLLDNFDKKREQEAQQRRDDLERESSAQNARARLVTNCFQTNILPVLNAAERVIKRKEYRCTVDQPVFIDTATGEQNTSRVGLLVTSEKESPVDKAEKKFNLRNASGIYFDVGNVGNTIVVSKIVYGPFGIQEGKSTIVKSIEINVIDKATVDAILQDFLKEVFSLPGHS